MKKSKTLSSAVAMVGMFTLVGACSVEDVDAPNTDDVGTDDPSLDEMYTVTVVDLDEGGKVVSEKLISKRDQIARRDRLAELEAQGLGQSELAIAQEADCIVGHPVGLPAFSLWDQTGYAGNRICFVGDGVADLSTYCRLQLIVPPYACVDTWEDSVQSFKVSSFETAAVFFADAPCQHCGSHAGSTNVSTANACEQTARYLRLDSPYLCPP